MRFQYKVAVDVRDLISVENVMESQDLGPNGALVFLHGISNGKYGLA